MPEQKPVVTSYAQFYKASSNGCVRYFPANSQEMKLAAIAYDESSDAVIVGGYGVYDTSESTQYAVALYADEEEAASHKLPKPKKASKKLFSTPPLSDNNGSGKRRL